MLLFHLLLASILSTATGQQGVSNISLGSTLTPTSTSNWLSPSGNFAFGFYPQGNGFNLGIWFANIWQKTVIWTANRDVPPLPSDVRLILNEDGVLILQFNQSQQSILVSNTDKPASSASILDSGNFVLYDSELKIIWQTFATPTDTIVSGQSLVDRRLVSSISNSNHSSGSFLLSMQTDGNLVLYPAKFPITRDFAYWHAETYTDGKNVSLNLDTNGRLYLLNSTGFIIKTLDDGGTRYVNSIYRATIDTDGIFRLYSHNLDQNGNWSILWSVPDNRCDPIGLCGSNSYCNPVNQGFSCVCLPGFDYINQTQTNLGCKNKSSVVDCSSSSSAPRDFTTLRDILWEDNSYSFVNSTSEFACQDECSRDCKCEAAIYSDGLCKKHKFPLNLGRYKPTNQLAITCISTSTKSSTTPNGDTESKNKIQIGILVAGVTCLGLGLAALSIFGILALRYRVWAYRKIFAEANGDMAWDSTIRSFTYQELERATNGFTEKLGRGAFGTVFKGALSNGHTLIAVKKLEKVMDEGEVEFQNEMRSIGRTHHRNLVRLIGYCHDKSNILLVYEYMNNGSLADFLFKSETRPNWEKRIQIAVDIARGILYLHEECENQIIHCDINPKNILMDKNWFAKISDFGLAKLLKPDQSKTVTGIRGTRGYVAPEWYKNQAITTKADVYSFGIVFLEVICCRRSVRMDVEGDEAILAEWVYKCFEENELEKLLITTEDLLDVEILKRMVSIGLWCIQDEPSLRLSMKKVVLMLEGIVEAPNPPSSNSFSNVL